MFGLDPSRSRFDRAVSWLLCLSVSGLYVLGGLEIKSKLQKHGQALSEAVVKVQNSVEQRERSERISRVRFTPKTIQFPKLTHRKVFEGSEDTANLKGLLFSDGSLRVGSARDLDKKLSELNYSLDDIRSGFAPVPRLRVISFPHDLAQVDSSTTRKKLFIKSILPLILRANEMILADRRKLLDITKSGLPMGKADRNWIAALGHRYDSDPQDIRKLLRRVDMIPPSLAIAQAAEESGWGTSRFALEANAVFGQWTFRKGEGVVPMRRDPGKQHEVRSFKGLQQSVDAYMRNLNIHWAYRDFRYRRSELRSKHKIMTGFELVGTLLKYSQQGPKYIATIRTIMQTNGLGEFDDARLQSLGT